MICPYCKNEMRITGSSIVLQGDDTPAAQTKVYTKQTLACQNPKCNHYTTDVLHLLHPTAETEEN
ncbi:hypothetical protein LJB77_01470 [Ruminococcaceae bacterium OttesenSCG-928-N02]|nr:hypothetical protein [Ruminococcaceae bacterium OttesenSCG-928-N02]